jgi:hypothetical protein
MFLLRVNIDEYLESLFLHWSEKVQEKEEQGMGQERKQSQRKILLRRVHSIKRIFPTLTMLSSVFFNRKSRVTYHTIVLLLEDT